MSPDRLRSQLSQVTRLLRDPGRSLPQRLYDLSEQNAYLVYLLEKAPPGAATPEELSALQDELTEALFAAIAEDPHVREDETWGNTSALLNFLTKGTGRPWRAPDPEPRELLDELVAILDVAEDWAGRLLRLDEHTTLGDYNRSIELFQQGLEGDDSPRVLAQMERLRRLFKASELPRTHWWTVVGPDWVGDWFRERRRGR